MCKPGWRCENLENQRRSCLQQVWYFTSMESLTLPRLCGHIVIPLLILTSMCGQGMEAKDCNGNICGYGTSCVKGQCSCNPGHAALRRVFGTNVQFCSRNCWSSSYNCPYKTTCKWVLLYSTLTFRRLCECSSNGRSPSTGECEDVPADGCGGRCGYRATCEGGVCLCDEASDILTSSQITGLQFCLQRCRSKMEVCPANAICSKPRWWYKGYACFCSAGARRSARGQCLDIDECTKKANVCGNNSVCTNTVGSYKCACVEGYRQKEGEEKGCSLDIDECTENQTICGINSVCANTVGSYSCACAEGYRQREDEEIGCSLDVDECMENETICGNNSVCTNTVGIYTCACAEGYSRGEGEEMGCNLVTSASAPSTAADSPALTVGLAVGIGGAVLVIAVVVVVIRSRARNRSRGAVRGDIGLEKYGKRSNVIAYENVTDQPQRGVGNSTDSELPDVLASSADFRPGNDIRYEEVDLQTQDGLNRDPHGLYSLAGHFDDETPSEGKHKDLYSNHKIANNKVKQLGTKKTQASQNESTYNVLSKPNAKPTISVANIPDNYNTLYDLKPTNENPGDSQSGPNVYECPHKSDDVQYDTTYATVKEDNGLPLTSKEEKDRGEYDQLKVQKI